MTAITNLHPTAVIDPSARIHRSAKIGPYAVIGEDVVIGENCLVGAHAHVEFTHMGRDNRLLPGCFVGGPPQDLKYGGERTRLVMGNNNTVREAVTLNRGTSAHGQTRIGDNCLFMAYSHVAHDCLIGNNVVVVNSVAVAGHVEIGDFAVLGGLAAIHQFVKIGRFCMLGGGAMVNKDVPPFCLAQGDRAALRGLNLLGLRRAGFPRDEVSAIKEAYKTLFLSGLTQAEALAKLKSRAQPAPVLEMLDFIERSKRGVTRPRAGAAQDEEVAV